MKQKTFLRVRILALDTRAHRIGYSIFEQKNLLEAGITRFKTVPVAASHLERILRRAQPQVLVMRRISAASSRNCPGTRRIQEAAQHLAKRSAMRVVLVNGRQIRERFLKEDTNTKYQIASFLARVFPSLAWRLPPPRNAWDGEHRNMSIFDAVALGVTYFTNMTASKIHNVPQLEAEFFRRSPSDE